MRGRAASEPEAETTSRSGRTDSSHDDAFTLIELLVVVIIIGILAAIAIPVFLNQREKARNGAANSDTRNLATSEEAYYAEFDEYTSDWTALAAQQNGLTDGVLHAVCTYDTQQKYIVAGWHPDGTLVFIFDSVLGSVDKIPLADDGDTTEIGSEWDGYVTDPAADACDEFATEAVPAP